jgi:hypothetical protein
VTRETESAEIQSKLCCVSKTFINGFVTVRQVLVVLSVRLIISLSETELFNLEKVTPDRFRTESGVRHRFRVVTREFTNVNDTIGAVRHVVRVCPSPSIEVSHVNIVLLGGWATENSPNGRVLA